MALTKTQIVAGIRPVGRRLTAKEARWIDELDTTPYVVVHPANWARGWAECRIQVTGYTSAKAVARTCSGSVILTEAEHVALGRTPFFKTQEV